MRHLLLSLVLCLVMAFPTFAAGSEAKLTLEGDQIFLLKGGKSTPISQEEFPAQPIDETDMRFLGVGVDGGKKYGVKPGLYIFKGAGEPVAFAPTEDAEFCADVRFSPKGDVVAVDSGTYLIRNWSFFSFPEMKPMGATSYYQVMDQPPIVWGINDVVAVSSMDVDEHGRICGYDPCGPVSVISYDLNSQKTFRLLVGTDLCDYTLTGIQDDGVTLTAKSLCLQSPADWETFPDEALAQDVLVFLP